MLSKLKKGKLIVISGPSGSGKTTVANELCRLEPQLQRSISVTTRKPRKNEKSGVQYYFVSEAEFKKKIENDEFAEWAQYNSNYYGTLRTTLEDALKKNKEIVLEIDVQGAEQLQKLYPEEIFIFIIPPSQSILENRLENRGTESEEEIYRRLSIAQNEIRHAKNYDYVVVNYEDKFNQTVEQIRSIIIAKRCRTNEKILEKIREEFLLQRGGKNNV